MAAHYYVNTFDLPPDQARAIWCEITDETYDLTSAICAGSDYRFASHMWFAKDILFFRFRAKANTITRPSMLVEEHPNHFIKVKLYKYGGETIELDGEKLHLDSSSLHFIDQNRPKSEVHTDHELMSIFLPYHVLGYDPSRHPPVLSFSLDSAFGRFLLATIDAAFQELENLSQNETAALAESISGVLRSVLTNGRYEEKTSDTQYDQVNTVKGFIEKNLKHTWLGVDVICQELNLSRATLYRHLNEFGGLNRYILLRRLNNAYRDLSEAQPVRGVVKAASERWGFASQAHFSRAFKEEFDVTPVSLVGRWARNPHDTTTTDIAQEHGKISQYSPGIAALKWAFERYR
ncbi:helix-turn-helix domain-containing protein [Tateyamaria sp. Alg231-49]|uniref:helix-turn-helix domain-containing protein n=1 Tax=Tateyamaria sp. Alg231-49 TaxID=1922219 RepID=UPI000D562866|nr:helix-turn-helix domain-containing protein [Tateyamaria sp. Alg231-49]